MFAWTAWLASGKRPALAALLLTLVLAASAHAGDRQPLRRDSAPGLNLLSVHSFLHHDLGDLLREAESPLNVALGLSTQPPVPPAARRAIFCLRQNLNRLHDAINREGISAISIAHQAGEKQPVDQAAINAGKDLLTLLTRRKTRLAQLGREAVLCLRTAPQEDCLSRLCALKQVCEECGEEAVSCTTETAAPRAKQQRPLNCLCRYCPEEGSEKSSGAP